MNHNEHMRMNSYSNRLNTFNSWMYSDNDKCTGEKKNNRCGVVRVHHNDNQVIDVESIIGDLTCVGVLHMAEAGFYLIQAPDSVRCYVCLKELDGWEPNDDPFQEHLSHSKKCDFLRLSKGNTEDKFTVKEFLTLKYISQTKAMERCFDEYIKSANTQFTKATNEIKDLMK